MLEQIIIQKSIDDAKQNVAGFDVSKLSDGYHTFEELYEFRKQYNAAVFNAWALANLYDVHKSERHYDGDLCFGGGWFVVVAMLPTGQITNHYKMEDWILFQVPSVEKAKYEFDGHTGQDVLSRLDSLNKGLYVKTTNG